MDSEILQSIVDFTRHRDLDSLEYSLVATLAEITPVSKITIYKTLDRNSNNSIEQILQLLVNSDESDESNYQWDDKPQLVTADKPLTECIETGEQVSEELDNGYYKILMPITSENTPIGCISIIGSEIIISNLPVINGFIKIYENYQIILNESEHDKLTGLFNRQTFDKKLGRLLQAQSIRDENYSSDTAVEKRNDPIAESHTWLAVLDFDGFKQINDSFGHVYGDEVLLILSQKMKQCFRKTDLLFRFGGDEFVIILEPVVFEEALDALERFRNSVASHHFPQIGQITISTGFARINPSDYPPSILEKADKALYYAKKNGRNCTFNYEELVQTNRLQEHKSGGAIDLF